MTADKLLKEELYQGYANKYLADENDIENITNESLEKAFRGCVRPARPHEYEIIKALVQKTVVTVQSGYELTEEQLELDFAGT